MTTNVKKNPPAVIHQRRSDDDKAFEKMSNIMNASIALLSLCITVISLFQIADKRATYLSDELFSISSALFVAALLASYLHTKGHSNEALAKAANAVFTSALFSMIVAGLYLIFEL